MTQLYIADIDICATRHGGAETSVIANRKVDKERDRERILQLLRHWPQGLTLHEACSLLGKEANAISGRFTELGTMNQIYHHGSRTFKGHTGRIYFAEKNVSRIS